MVPFAARQRAGAPGIKAIEMEARVASSGQGEIRQTHARLLSPLRFTPSTNRCLSPIEAFETGGVDPSRHRAVGVARRHARHPTIRLGAGGADDEKFVYSKFLTVADDPGGVGGWLIGFVKTVQIVGSGVFQVVSQMPDPGKPFCGPEHALAIALAGSLIMAPMHPDRLLIIPLDRGNPHPDRGVAGRGIPIFDLVCQRLSLGGEADVIAPGLRLTEIEIVPMDSNKQWKVLETYKQGTDRKGSTRNSARGR